MEANYEKHAKLMKALSDETRVKIFHILANGELCACDILEELSITQPTLSYHMKILCEAELVKGRRDGVWARYCINQDTLAVIKQFFNDIKEACNS